MRIFSAAVGLIVLGALAGCEGESKKKDPVPGTARFLNGVTSSAFTFTFAGGTPSAATGGGSWNLSPDEVTATITGVTFEGDSNWDSPMSDCSVTYDRSAGVQSEALTCPFGVAPGTYNAVRLSYSRTYQVLVDDPVNGFFTDPSSSTLLSTTLPAGGAAPIDFTTNGGGNRVLYLTEPLVITDEASVPQLDVVMHGIHTLFVSLAPLEFRGYDKDPVALFPSITGAGKAAFYSNAGTADNVNVDNVPAELFFFYDDFGPKEMMTTYTGGIEGCMTGGPGSALAADPAQSPVGSDGNRAGGYLGLDSSGALCWALGANNEFSSYQSIWRMMELDSAGSAVTTLQCQVTTTAPPPVSGSTYSSGCPTLGAITASEDVSLVAD